MIADEREGPIETAFKMLTAPVWVPIYSRLCGLPQVGRGMVEAQAEAGRAGRSPAPVRRPGSRRGNSSVPSMRR